MKKLLLIMVIVGMGMWITTNAQTGNMPNDPGRWAGKKHAGIMHQGMGGDRMNDKMQHMTPEKMYFHQENMMATIQQMMPYLETVKRLPGMQQELSLNDDQVIKLIDLQTAFLKQEVDLKADMIKEELKLKTLLQSDASAKDISEQLKSCAASHIDIGVAAYETANKMKTILNDTQKKEMNEVVAKPNPDYFDHMKNERGNIIKFCHHHYHHWGIGLTWIMGLIIIGLLVWLLVKVNKNCKPKEK